VTEKKYVVRIGGRTIEVVRRGADRCTIEGTTYEFVVGSPASGIRTVSLGDRRFEAVVSANRSEDAPMDILLDGIPFTARVDDERALLLQALSGSAASTAHDERIHAPMPGKIVKVLVDPGDRVEAGAGLLILEAMKMENEIRSNVDGVVLAVHARAADSVEKGALLIELEAGSTESKPDS
jgi:biotin carboxyl carrier protein